MHLSLNMSANVHQVSLWEWPSADVLQVENVTILMQDNEHITGIDFSKYASENHLDQKSD